MRGIALPAFALVLASCGSPPSVSSSAYPTVDPCADIPTPSPYRDQHHPSPRIGAALAYDGSSRRLILFSGVRGDNSCQLARSWIFDDTWAWDGHAWSQLHPKTTPHGRSFGSFAFDVSRGQAVLFGGGSADSDPQRMDTWLWDGDNWRPRNPPAVPSAPLGPATYDAALSGIIGLSDRLWLWDGSRWFAMPGAAPVGATEYALADDPSHLQLVLYGAFTRPTGLSYETWIWDGTTWRQRQPAHPPAGGPAYAVYDPVHRNVLMFDGATYTWDGHDWTQQYSTTSPQPRRFASMAFDTAIGRTVLFGGKSIYRDSAGAYVESINNELWSWDGANWREER